MTSQPHHALPPKVRSALSNAYTILIVDDNDTNRMILGKLLNRVGYRTFEAVDGVDGLEKLRSNSADIAILDVEMPRMNGIELVHELRAWEEKNDHPRLPIIVASGNSSDQMEADAIAASCDVFLTKPFDFPNLLKTIRELINSRNIQPVSERMNEKPGNVDADPANAGERTTAINSVSIPPLKSN